MGKIKRRPPVKLIIGLIFKKDTIYRKTKATLEKKFGKIDFESERLAFCYTGYYAKEFGSGLKRSFISFKKLIPPQNLAAIKIFTNTLEQKLSLNSLRTVNIDPGYIELAKLVLASTKDYKHRIYLGKGIYAEITLSFAGKTFIPQECTYPDYRSAEYISIFNKIRQIYAQQIKNL